MEYTKKRKIYIGISAVVVAAIMITIFWLSAQDGEESTDTSGWFMNLIIAVFGQAPEQELLRTVAHFCEYVGLSFFVSNLIFSLKNKFIPLLGVVFSWLYAWSDEIHQIFVPGRAFQLTDLLVDLGGVVTGTAVFGVLFFIFFYRKNRKKEISVDAD